MVGSVLAESASSGAGPRQQALVIDGLQIARWGRSVFESMHRGGLSAVMCTCAVWEHFEQTMDNIAAFKSWFIDYADIIRPVICTNDIRCAQREGRVGIGLCFQNASPVGDRLSRLALFRSLGVGIIQVAYNTQNLVGAGCYEPVDSGLTRFGREFIAEMNRVGILADLSHVGPQTSADIVSYSRKPVVYSHVCPAGLLPHPRNKTDDELRAVAATGGLVGVTLFPSFLRAGNGATVDDYVEAIEYTIDVVGEDCVGIGTDFVQEHGPEFLEWLIRDKGYLGPVTKESPQDLRELVMPDGMAASHDFPNLAGAMRRRSWSESRLQKVLGENWLRVLNEVWGT